MSPRKLTARTFALSCAAGWVLLPITITTAEEPTRWVEYYRLYNRNSTVLTNARPDSDLFPVRLNEFWSLIDQRGVLLVEPDFLWTDDGVDGLARAMAPNGKTGFINGIGQWRIEPTFDWLDRFAENRAVFRENGRYGLIDQRGRVVREPIYQGLLRFKDGYAAAMLDGKIGYLDRRLEWAIPPQFATARSFHDGLAAVQFFDEQGNAGRWGYIDIRGQTQWQDPTGRITELRDFNENLAAFRALDDQDNQRWGYLDQRFNVAIPARFADARDFTNRLAAVSAYGEATQGEPNSGWGYINRAGHWEIPPTFDWADDFDDRLAMFVYQGKFGFIDRAGKTGLYPKFADAEPFERGFATVSDGTHLAYVNANGGVIWDPADFLAAEPIDEDRLGRQSGDRRSLRVLDKRTGTIARSLRHGFRNAVPYRFYRGQLADEPIRLPYEPEYLYDEVLPQPTAGGLLEPIAPINPQTQSVDDEQGRTWIEPELKGVVPEIEP